MCVPVELTLQMKFEAFVETLAFCILLVCDVLAHFLEAQGQEICTEVLLVLLSV